MRRTGRSSSIVILMLCVGLAVSVLARGASSKNPIQIENALPGTTAWQLTNAATNHEIEGYASLTSVNRGSQISFFVNTTDPSFTIEIFRMGWYGGLGGRRMTSAVTLTGVQQVVPAPDPNTGVVDCNWSSPYTIATTDPSDSSKWLSGVYLAKLTGTSSGKQSYIIFVVREDSRSSNILVEQPATTSATYNAYGGKSLYDYNSTNGLHAVKVSFNRPYDTGWGTGNFLSREFDGISFLEQDGDDVTYATTVDTHENARSLVRHKVFLSIGHDEYWSWEMRQNVESARDSGVSLGFMGANDVYWRTRMEASLATGAADRIVVCYKDDDLSSDPDASNPATYNLVTTLWREGYISSPAMPEDGLMGEMYNNFEPVDGDVLISGLSPSWVFSNTGLSVGNTLHGLLGYEVDQMFADSTTPANAQLVTHSPYVLNGATEYGDMSVYTSSSGSTVFDFGTTQWVWGLSNISPSPWGPVPARTNIAAQQITRNVLNQLISTSHIGGPTPTPTSTAGANFQIASPTNGAQVSGSVTIKISTTLSTTNDWWNELQVDGVSTGLNDAGHYQQIIWDASKVTNGAHTLTVLAHQESTGTVMATASITVTVSNGGPTPTPSRTLTPTSTATSTPAASYQITAPLNGATVSGLVKIAISTNLSVTNDWWNELQVDGVSTGLNDAGHYQKITWDSTKVSNGSHTLTVLAHQESTGTITATASISLTVSNGAPTPTPTGTPSSTYVISAPSNGATVAGSVTITISTNLSVTNDWWNELLVDNLSTGLNDAGHYQQITWDSTKVGNGAHTLTVRAHQESTGTIMGSATVSVTVSNH